MRRRPQYVRYDYLVAHDQNVESTFFVYTCETTIPNGSQFWELHRYFRHTLSGVHAFRRETDLQVRNEVHI